MFSYCKIAPLKAQDPTEREGGPGPPSVPNGPHGLCGRKAVLRQKIAPLRAQEPYERRGGRGPSYCLCGHKAVLKRKKAPPSQPWCSRKPSFVISLVVQMQLVGGRCDDTRRSSSSSKSSTAVWRIAERRRFPGKEAAVSSTISPSRPQTHSSRAQNARVSSRKWRKQGDCDEELWLAVRC